MRTEPDDTRGAVAAVVAGSAAAAAATSTSAAAASASAAHFDCQDVSERVARLDRKTPWRRRRRCRQRRQLPQSHRRKIRG